MEHLQPWMGDAVAGLQAAGTGPAVVGFDLSGGKLARMSVDIALLRHGLQWGIIQATGITGLVRLQMPENPAPVEAPAKQE